jgi:hypothetical protein
MSDNEGTYAALMELQTGKRPGKPDREQETPPPEPKADQADAMSARITSEDLTVTPYISQNYRFTEDELRWLRQQAYKLSEKLGMKVSQNAILRVALAALRELYDKNPRSNPLIEAISRLKK